jgi:hypothetical protein
VAQSAATKLVNRAARQHLRPLGLQQRGRSRLWLDDHGWWVVAVDFESSAYAQGSRLAVFADFMWHGRDYLAYAVGGRVRERGRLLDQDGRELSCDFDGDEETFERCAALLAERAAAEVAAWREGFPTLERWAHYLDRTTNSDLWRQYDAAMAAALTGDAKRARRWFGRVLKHRSDPDLFDDPSEDWVVQAQRDAQALRQLLDDPEAFVSLAEQRARSMREHLGLPACVQAA